VSRQLASAQALSLGRDRWLLSDRMPRPLRRVPRLGPRRPARLPSQVLLQGNRIVVYRVVCAIDERDSAPPSGW